MPKQRRTRKSPLAIDCTTKRAYRTERDAKHGAETQMLSNWQLELRVYRCPYGHGWHLTRAHDSDTISI